MPLIDDLKNVCDRLSPLGWRDLLLKVTGNALDIHQPNPAALRAALLAPLAVVDRTVPGFTDFASGGKQGITPFSPATSLLYHALAAPAVKVGVNGPLGGFPTSREIETAENFVFGVQPPTIAALRQRVGLAAGQNLSVVMFAYEYRPAGDTCSQLQADLVFSRTGVSRVGTRAAKYNAEIRGFDSEAADDPFAFQVCPARYGAFLSVRRKGSKPGFVPMRFQQTDAAADFWVPVHKLFNGPECLQGLNLQLSFDGFHYNDKIRRVQVFLNRNPPATAPFQLTTGIADFLTGTDLCQGLLCAIPHARLVEEVKLNGAFVTFPVPANNSSAFAALEPGAVSDPATGAEVRPAPAYVHARTKVKNGALSDLGNDPTHPDVLQNVRTGGYDALHYTDFTGDGRIDVAIAALNGQAGVEAATHPAYSLVAAPDFFPGAGQRELTEWTNSSAVPSSLRQSIWGVDPQPLCDTRLPANLQMPGNRFDSAEVTVTALVPLFGPAPAAVNPPLFQDALRHSCLPDDAAGIFAPGWDVSTDKIRKGAKRIHHLAAYGLGSPFPEDSKLCAALSTFWATVAPDVTRGMSINSGNPGLRHTVAPLTDDEIGQAGVLPWDGNPGPKRITVNGQQFAECESFLHVDYVRMALQQRFTSRLTARVGSDEYERRVLSMAFIYAVLADDPNNWFVLSFLRVEPGNQELQQAQIDASTVLPGTVYRADVFSATEATEQMSPTNFRKRLLPIRDEHFLLVDPMNRIVLERPAAQTIWARRTLTV